MNRWKGPAVAVAVFFAMLQFGPERSACVVRETVAALPPPPADRSASLLALPATPSTAPVPPDPFALATAPPATSTVVPGARAQGPAPTRPWKVTGLVGRRAAVLVLPDGQSVVVSVGQTLDSARVVGISGAGVELEDRGGRFLLKVR